MRLHGQLLHSGVETVFAFGDDTSSGAGMLKRYSTENGLSSTCKTMTSTQTRCVEAQEDKRDCL